MSKTSWELKQARKQGKAIVGFRGLHFWLSNDAPSPIIVDGVLYPTVRHAYVAAMRPDSSHHLARVRAITDAKELSQLERRLLVTPDWDRKKSDVMANLLLKKFTDYGLRQRLLATAGQVLVNTEADLFWGVVNSRGTNVLGKLLMAVRDHFATLQARVLLKGDEEHQPS